MSLFVCLFVCVFVEEGEYFLKVLIPSYAAGSIIGKGGQTIVQLQKETGATIKLSKSKDFYPGKIHTNTVNKWLNQCIWCVRVNPEPSWYETQEYMVEVGYRNV